MLLRTRVSLIVTVAFAAAGGIAAVAAVLVLRLLSGQIDAVLIDGQDALWRSTVAAAGASVGAVPTLASENPALKQALARRDRDGIRIAIEEDRRRGDPLGRIDRIELVAGDGLVLYQSDSRAGGQPLLEGPQRERVSAGTRLSGLVAAGDGRYFVVDARPIELPGGAETVLVAAIDATKTVAGFAAGQGAQAALLGLRGRLVASTDPARFETVADSISLRTASRSLVFGDGRVLAVISTPVPDLFGSVAGTLVSFRDIRQPFEALRDVLVWTAAVSAVLLALVVIGVYWHIASSIRPLSRAIEVLRALARGDTSVDLDEAGNDEIGRIGEAVRQFRMNAIGAEELARQRERTRRRRERLVRREVGALADVLDPQDRAEMLELLEPKEQPAARASTGGSTAQSSEHQLRLLAGVLRELVRRIIDQRERLSSVIAELEDALATKEKLIGLQNQLEIARQVQHSILPRSFGEDPRVSVYGLMTPAQEVGGDFFDCFMTDDDTLVVVVADVSGKGIPAALFMAVTRTLFRAVARFSADPAAVVAEVNDLLARENDQMMFVTALFGRLDLKSGAFHFVNAGHSAPILIEANGRAREVGAPGGMALAVTDNLTYRAQGVALSPGDTLFVYTDGVTEAQDPAGHLFNTERLLAALSSHPAADERRLCLDVEARVRAFEAGQPATDDLTCLAVGFQGTRPARRVHLGMPTPADATA